METLQRPGRPPIGDQTATAGQSLLVTLQASDPNNLPLTYSAIAETQSYYLESTLSLFADSGGYYTNFRGGDEKYLRGTVSSQGYTAAGGPWYYILPNGDFYEFAPPYSNPNLTGVLVAHLGVAVYNDHSLLWNAQNIPAPTILSVTGDQLTITPNAGFTGTFEVSASVSNGTFSASRAFRVTVS
jgi:hypothetical protein